MPDSSTAGPSSYNNNNTTTTTTTTTFPTTTVTTTIPSRGRPYTVTSSQPGNVAPVTVTSSTGGTSRGPSTRTTVATPPRLRPIGIRRLPSSLQQREDGTAPNGSASGNVSRSSSLRGRSTSAPQHMSAPSQASNNLTRQNTRQSLLPTVTEGHVAAAPVDRETMNETTETPRRRRSVSNAARSVLSNFSNSSRERERQGPNSEYDSDVVDLLDVLGRLTQFLTEVAC